jgi:hypothetical protein
MSETKKPNWQTSVNNSKMYYVPSLEGLNTEQQRINQRLANEDGQNRIDAAIDINKTVEVRITEKIIKDSLFYEKYINGLQNNLKKNKNNKIFDIDKKNIKILVIECFNTKGLTGSYDKSDNNNYERFFLGSTEGKSGASLGRRQLGRHVYMLASKLKGFLALSIENDNKNEFLRGIQYLDRWENENNQKMEAYSSYTYPTSSEKQNPMEQLPILDQDIIKEFKKFTGINRSKNETGLSIVIPEPLEGVNAEKLFKHYIRRFFPAIINSNLKIRYKDQVINTDNIDEILENERMMSPEWIEFYRDVYTSKEKHYTSDGNDYNYDETIDREQIPQDVIDKIKKDYFAGKNISLKLGVKIPFEKKSKNKEEISYFNIALKKIESSNRTVYPLFLRGNLQIPNEKGNFKFHKNCYSALWTDDDAISEMLGDSEGMAHDSWNRNHPQIQENYNTKKTYKLFSYIKSSLSTIYSIITDKKDEIDFESFAEDLPTIQDIHLEDEIVNQDILFDKPVKPIPISPPRPSGIHAKKMVKEIPIENGFKVIKTEHCENKNFPMKVRVRFAFRARKKNSFTCFNKNLHFDLKKVKDVKISKKQNVEITNILENEVDFTATDPNFEINITGFKDLNKKDLDVRARKLKG